MLRSDDIERFLDAAEEFGYEVEEKDVEGLWRRYEESIGESNVPLPFSTDELADIIGELVKTQ